ncbi:MAG: hypothetical protein GYB67_00005, partial [Chloroflexi bacterium]|nr:hypothetical protein [Chloroflexota bacterium]
LLLIGLGRADELIIRDWERLAADGEAFGFSRFVAPIKALAAMLGEQRHRLEWEWQPAARQVFKVAGLARFAQEEVVEY